MIFFLFKDIDNEIILIIQWIFHFKFEHGKENNR